MRLRNPEGLTTNLEYGIGEVHPILGEFDASLRLRVQGACGIATVALAHHYRELGYTVDLVVSSPRLAVDPLMRHAMAVVRRGGNSTIIDSNYTSFLSYAGALSHAVNGDNFYPASKIALVQDGHADEMIDELVDCVKYIAGHVKTDVKASIFCNKSREEIRLVFAEIWNSSNFDTFNPSALTLEAGKKLAKYILAKNLEFDNGGV